MVRVEEVQLAFEAKGFEITKVTLTDRRLQYLGRVRPSNNDLWGLARNALEDKAFTAKNWTLDISKVFFKNKPGPREELWAWRVIITSTEHIDLVFSDVMLTLNGVMLNQAGKELESYPLPGATANRNAPRNGGGAGKIGELPVGPQLMSMLRNNGGG